MMNKKGSSWWIWIFIIMFILIMTSAVRHSIIRHSMHDDITGKVIDNYNEELQRQQEEDYYQQIQEEQQRQYEEGLRHQQEQKYQEQQDESQQQEEIQQSISSSCKSGYVNEYRCSGNNIQQKYQYSDCSSTWIRYWHCAYGCENSKCKDCYDSDGGKDYYTKGYIDYGSEGKGYDRCYEYEGYENYLAEYYCDSSGSHIETYKYAHMVALMVHVIQNHKPLH